MNCKLINFSAAVSLISLCNIINAYEIPQAWNSGCMYIERNPIRYCLYYLDDESGMYYCKARYYSSEMMCFISRDTYNLPNRYYYCSNNPVSYSDPDGHLDTSNHERQNAIPRRRPRHPSPDEQLNRQRRAREDSTGSDHENESLPGSPLSQDPTNTYPITQPQPEYPIGHPVRIEISGLSEVTVERLPMADNDSVHIPGSRDSGPDRNSPVSLETIEDEAILQADERPGTPNSENTDFVDNSETTQVESPAGSPSLPFHRQDTPERTNAATQTEHHRPLVRTFAQGPAYYAAILR